MTMVFEKVAHRVVMSLTHHVQLAVSALLSTAPSLTVESKPTYKLLIHE